MIREVRPQVLVTYDTFGGYGHPDHIQAHRVAMYAAQLAEAPGFRPDLGPAWTLSKIYWMALPRSYVQRGIKALVESGSSGFFGVESADELPFLTDDALVTTHVEALAFEPVKMAALREHATQVQLDHGFFQLAEIIGPEAMGNEFFMLVRAPRAVAWTPTAARRTSSPEPNVAERPRQAVDSANWVLLRRTDEGAGSAGLARPTG